MDRRIDWENLRRLYEFESLRVSGPGSYRLDIQSVLWTFDELKLALSLSYEDTEVYKKLIGGLEDKRQVMKVSFPDGNDRYVTRVAETARLLGHNYEYWYRGRQGIDSVRWLIEDKKIPARSITAQDFINDLLKEVQVEVGDGDSTFNLREAVRKVIKGVATYFEPREWEKARFSRFQLEATKEMILSQFKLNHAFKSQVLTAGVGSGKTIAFSIAMLVSAVEGILSGEKHRRCHLFLYPRKALAHDQYTKLRKIAEKIEVQQLDVHFEHYSYYSSKGQSVKKGIEGRYSGPNPAPSIVVTTLETLNRRLTHPLVISKLSEYLSRVVLDEIHLIEGMPGCHVVRLLDRLRQACSPRSILWTGSSATVASPDLHAATVFGIERESVKVLEPSVEDLRTVGLVHHVFLRPTGRLSFLGTLVNSTSILVHNRRDGVYEDRRSRNYPKTIGFADNLDLLGRWNSDLRENERTEDDPFRRHPKTEKPEEGWSAKQREIPYALRFIKPLERRVRASGGQPPAESYEDVLEELRDDDICDKCRAGERRSLGTANKEEMHRLARLVYRRPSEKEDKVRRFNLDNKDIFDVESAEIGTLDLCPYLRAGACFWFALDDFGTEPILKGRNPRYEWRHVARSKVHSSKTKSKIELDDDLSELVFKSTIEEVYDLQGDDPIPVDIVLASPSLEVGVDLPNVTESLMFKAIRSVASYRQKVGRIGREEDSDIMNSSLISLRPVDLHYYRQPRKITSTARLEPIPLKEYNDSILRCALYMAVWDYLALYSNLPEVIPISSLSAKETEFAKRLKNSRDFLINHRHNAEEYLSGVTRGRFGGKHEAISLAISQVLDEINILLTPTAPTIDDERITYIADMISVSLSKHKFQVSAPIESRNRRLIEWGAQEYRKLRPDVNPVLLGLSSEFQDLDLFSDSGWVNRERIIEIHSKIEDTLEDLQEHEKAGTLDNEVRRDIDAVERICDRVLEDIIKGLEGMVDSGENPVVAFFYEQYEDFKNEHPYWPYYLSYTVQGLPIFRTCRNSASHTRPPNLFTNPYEENVVLSSKSQIEGVVPVSEALFGFIPGTWTFRIGKTPRKTKVGRLEAFRGGLLQASLGQMELAGNEFFLIKKSVPAPPFFPSDSLAIYMPKKLAIDKVYVKYVLVNRTKGTIVDRDEDSKTSGFTSLEADEGEEDEKQRQGIRVKIPKSYLERSVHIVPSEGKGILVNNIDEEYLTIEENQKKTVRGVEARKRISHPMLNGLINSVSWHDRLDIYDYVYSVSRAFTSKHLGNATLVFRDKQNRDMAIGRYFETEGVSLGLNSETVKSTASKITQDMLAREKKWVPSLAKALHALISSSRLADGTQINRFAVDDLLGIIVTFAYQKSGFDGLTQIQKMPGILLEDSDQFKNAALEFYKGKYLIGRGEEEQEELSEQDEQDIDKQIDIMLDLARGLIGELTGVEKRLDDWIKYTLVNSFGMSCLSALQKLCGSKDEEIGYSVDLESLRNGKYRVFLYDRNYHGNGSTDVLRRYLHILNIQRHRQTDESRLLPTEDFFTLLEEELLQCAQFHADMDALEKLKQKGGGLNPEGLPELGYVSAYSDEVLRVCEETWKTLGISGREDSWKLPLIALAPGSFARMNNLEVDNVIRASNICWNGCPECLINTEAMIGLAGVSYIDKAILDEWFRTGRTYVEEYKVLSAADLAQGRGNLLIGRQTRVSLELPDRKIRSISLPFTIGFELDRETSSPHANLIIRDSDMSNLCLFDEASKGSAHGIESLGFKRVMWFNLISAAYLDVLGLLEEKRKEIIFVFYDCRDVTFDDVGISNRMTEVIEYHSKKSDKMGELRWLSEILIWLARRRFRISFCVDENRSKEQDVHSFLEKITGTENIEVRTKRLKGLMHKKALITPIGIIQGSANLTYSGTRLNEEIVNYAPYGVREYKEMEVNIKDTFHGSKGFEGP